jgi:fatty-acyl-CoA synthase
VSIFERDLGRTVANYTPLSPLTFIERAAATFPDRAAVVYGDHRYSWSQTYARARQLASALRTGGVAPGR